VGSAIVFFILSGTEDPLPKIILYIMIKWTIE
jgi:hypothetical protein